MTWRQCPGLGSHAKGYLPETCLTHCVSVCDSHAIEAALQVLCGNAAARQGAGAPAWAHAQVLAARLHGPHRQPAATPLRHQARGEVRAYLQIPRPVVPREPLAPLLFQLWTSTACTPQGMLHTCMPIMQQCRIGGLWTTAGRLSLMLTSPR